MRVDVVPTGSSPSPDKPTQPGPSAGSSGHLMAQDVAQPLQRDLPAGMQPALVIDRLGDQARVDDIGVLTLLDGLRRSALAFGRLMEGQ